MHSQMTACRPFLQRIATLFLLLFLVPLLTSCGEKKTIVNGLEEREANEILVFLATKNIQAFKVPQPAAGGGGGAKVALYDISVEPEQAPEAMSLLNQAGLPRRKPQNLLGIFQNVGLVPSETTEQIRFEAGLAEQIASTIRKIDGVLDAEVRISFPKEDPLDPGSKNKQKITASVYVKHSGILDDPNAHLQSKIKRLVASSVTGLDYDNVTVILDRARFGEVPFGTSSVAEEEKQYVNIWSVIVAKESVTRFRTLFFSLSLTILLLLLLLVWIGWKILPLLEKAGGMRELLALHQLHIGPKPEEKKSAEGSAKKGEAKAAEKKEDSDSGVDVT